MTIKNILIASHSYDEAITHCVIKNREHFEAAISIVLLADILFNYDIYDEINDSYNIVKWYKKDDLLISNKSHHLLTRVLYFPDSLFSKFMPEDKDYAQREFEAYIGFSFNAFFGVSNKTTTGLCEKALSLPQQWNRVNKECNVNIPTYYWGPGTLNPLSGNRIVTSDIYNYLNWHPEHHIQEQDHIFCFEKPKGEPVFVLVIGSKMLITSDFILTAYEEKKIFELSKQISILTHYFVAEILLFIDGENVIFGCINAGIVRSVKNIHFDAFVIKNLISEFVSCVN